MCPICMGHYLTRNVDNMILAHRHKGGVGPEMWIKCGQRGIDEALGADFAQSRPGALFEIGDFEKRVG